jgi:type IV secretion system protein VirB6
VSAACDALVQNASAGVAASLRAVDCVSAETTASAFARLFGTQGVLLPALTLLLTLYVASFAILLMTGRSSLSVRSLTPRMIMLGVVLTFTTSWVAYQSVVWNLTIGAPDQIAGVLMGTSGSATQMFADRIDILFNVITETASATRGPGASAGSGSFTPSNLMWLASLLLMLGTVGVLVTARIALAVLLALGPVFIAFALFGSTRGLFVGWLRGVILMAITPLFAVLGGAVMVELAVPVVAGLREAEGVDGRAAMALFVIAAVHCALMSLAIRVASTTVGAWSVFGLGESGSARSTRTDPSPSATAAASAATQAGLSRVQTLVAGLSSPGAAGPQSPAAGAGAGRRNVRNIVIPAVSSGASMRPAQPRRARGIGSRFASRAAPQREFLR